MTTPRRVLEPTGKFDRILYAVIALTGLHTIFLIHDNPDLQVATGVYVGWWLVSTFYTIDWVLRSYRRWKSAPRPES